MIPGKLKEIDTLSQDCVAPATEMAGAFEHVFNLAMELNTCCNASKGTYEEKLADAEMQKKYYETTRAGLKKDLDAAKAGRKILEGNVTQVSWRSLEPS